MIWILLAIQLLSLILFLRQRAATDQRLRWLEMQLSMIGTDEYWRLRTGISEHQRQMHELVLAARRRGNLDQANKLMELQRWGDIDYESSWLDGMFRGFP